MFWFRKAVDRGVKAGVEQAMAKATAPGGLIEQVVWREMDRQLPATGDLNEFGFLWALSLRFREVGCGFDEAKALAQRTLGQFLQDERIKFGDPAYEWSRAAAVDVADEYEIDHWEHI